MIVTANTAVWDDNGYTGLLIPKQFTLAQCFRASANDVRQYDRKPFTLVRVIDAADDTHDEEILPMFVVSIEGTEVEAFADEVTC